MKTDNELFPEYFPEDWAESYGQDDYGLWQGISVQGREIFFRWIPPGDFMMGSRDELEMSDSEGPQRRVTFDQGFWLAETACSQALWHAVRGDNPSKFQKNPENPVENISWDMAIDFMDRLNNLVPGLDVRLPSEAEWEYSCRAGTATPFSFGTELTPEDANYNGNYPYNKGKKSLYREETVVVKSFRPNPWGLYQMHGNVWEWCQDCWHASYEGGPDDGSPWDDGDSKDRVCRGGSWYHYGRYLRSACRNNWIDGVDNYGFRLARGPELKQEPGWRRARRGTSGIAA